MSSMVVVMPEVLREKLGDDGVQALADVINKTTVPRVELDSKLDTVVAKLDSLSKEMNTRFESLTRETNTKLDALVQELRGEIRTECAKVRVQTFAWTFGLFITLLATLYTLLK